VGLNQNISVTAEDESALFYTPPGQPATQLTEAVYGDQPSPVTKSLVFNWTAVDCPILFSLLYVFHAGNPVLQLKVNNKLLNDSQYFVSLPPLSVTSVSGCQDNGTATYYCLGDGHTTITIIGTRFRVNETSVRIGSLYCMGVNVINTTQLTCVLPSYGPGGMYKVEVQTPCGYGVSLVPLVHLYPAPVLADTFRLVNQAVTANLTAQPQTGGVIVELIGQNFGLPFMTVEVLYGLREDPTSWSWHYGLPCYNITRNNETSIQCTISPGSGQNLQFGVRVGALTSANSNFSLSYLPPYLNDTSIKTSIASSWTPVIPLSIPVVNLDMAGNNFGDPNDNSTRRIAILYGVVNNSLLQNPYQCQLRSINDTFIQCSTVRGSGSGLRFQLVTPYSDLLVQYNKASRSVISTTSLNYPGDIPEVRSVYGCSGQDGLVTTGCPSSGGPTIVVNGVNFNNSAPILVTVDDNDCPGVVVQNSSSLTCTLPDGVGLLQSIIVVVGNSLSESKRFVSYNPPSITGFIVSGSCRLEGNRITQCDRAGG